MLGLTTTTKKTLAGGGGPSLVIQWLKRQASNAESVGLIPGGGIKIPKATWQNKKKNLIWKQGIKTQDSKTVK